MRELLLSKIKNENGSGIIIFFIAMVFFVTMLLIVLADTIDFNASGDLDIQNGTNLAVKGAADRVDMTNHARGIFLIDSNSAHDAFRRVLADNLNLDESTLKTNSDRYEGSLDYVMVVYNNVDTPGVTQNTKYVCDNGSISTYSINNIAGRKFVIDGFDIVEGTGSGSIEIEEPGVIAVVKIKKKDKYTGEQEEIVRWAASKIHTFN